MFSNIPQDVQNRVKSLLWRALMMGIAAIITVLTNELSTLELGAGYAVVIGLVLGEISKSLNNKYGSIK